VLSVVGWIAVKVWDMNPKVTETARRVDRIVDVLPDVKVRLAQEDLQKLVRFALLTTEPTETRTGQWIAMVQLIDFAGSFAAAVSRARAKAKAKLVKVIVDASPKDFRAACWLWKEVIRANMRERRRASSSKKPRNRKWGAVPSCITSAITHSPNFWNFPTMDDPPEVAAEKQRRLLEMTPAKNAPVSA